MTDMPETIWVWNDPGFDAESGGWANKPLTDPQYEYRRADLTPSLDALAMQRAAADAACEADSLELATHGPNKIVDRIFSLPAPTPADALTEAMRLPKIKALVEAAQAVEQWDAARGYPIPYRVRDPLRAALAALTEGR